MRGLNQGPWIYSHGPLRGEAPDLAPTLSAAHTGDFPMGKVSLSPHSGSATSHHSVSREADIPHRFGGYARPFGASVASASLCMPLIYTPHQQSRSLAHPPAGLPHMTISALTCTSDTPVPRLISPESVSSAAIASARHLQAPDSLSPKDFLRDIEFLTRVSSGCLEKDVAQNYSKIAFSYFLCNY